MKITPNFQVCAQLYRVVYFSNTNADPVGWQISGVHVDMN
jgi:hypothetical protein